MNKLITHSPITRLDLPEEMFLRGHAVYEEGSTFGWQSTPFRPWDIVPIERPRKELKPQTKLILAVLVCLGLEITVGWIASRFL